METEHSRHGLNRDYKLRSSIYLPSKHNPDRKLVPATTPTPIYFQSRGFNSEWSSLIQSFSIYLKANPIYILNMFKIPEVYPFF